MIEKTVLDYLNEKLDCTVLMELPEVPSDEYPNWPDELVTIERVGGGKRDQIDNISIALQSHAGTLYMAVSLDEKVRNAMDDIVTLPEIGSAKLSSCYNHTDTRTKRYRYQSVYDLYFKEV